MDQSFPIAFSPFRSKGETYRNNQLWDPFLGSGSVPPLTKDLSCPFNVDGHSHFPMFWAEDYSYGPGGPIQGHYEFRITMLDATSNGWDITIKFTVQDGK